MSFSYYLFRHKHISLEEFVHLQNEYEKTVPSIVSVIFEMYPLLLEKNLQHFNDSSTLHSFLLNSLDEEQKRKVLDLQREKSGNLYSLLKGVSSLEGVNLKELYEKYYSGKNEVSESSVVEEVVDSGEADNDVNLAALESLKELGLYSEADFDDKKKSLPEKKKLEKVVEKMQTSKSFELFQGMLSTFFFELNNMQQEMAAKKSYLGLKLVMGLVDFNQKMIMWDKFSYKANIEIYGDELAQACTLVHTFFDAEDSTLFEKEFWSQSEKKLEYARTLSLLKKSA